MSTDERPRFHLAFPVSDLAATRRFLVDELGCATGRESDRWVDFDFFGHQLTAHRVDANLPPAPCNEVDGKQIPVAHFGLILEWDHWQELAQRLRRRGVPFLVEPHIRFAGQPGEQATLFIREPSGNGLEFKSFRDPGRIFAT